MTSVPEESVKTGSSAFLPARKISCVVPDDGTDRTLIQALRKEKGIVSTSSKPCRGISVLRNSVANRGRLPESEIVRLVNVIVPDDDVYEIFEYIYQVAGIGELGGGLMWLSSALKASVYTLPEGLPDEPDHS